MRHELPIAGPRSRARIAHYAVFTLAWLAYAGNFGAIVWIWLDHRNLTTIRSTSDLLGHLAQITGLLGAYLALVQVVLLARLPILERITGFDQLTHWHRWNGHLCVDLVIAHVVLQVWGYSIPAHRSFTGEFWAMIAQGIFPGMITATVGTVLLLAVAWSSLTIARRRLPYELWYAVHLTAYAGIALAWFHEIPTGGDLALNHDAANYWRALFIATLAALAYRVLSPFASAFRYRLRVAEVIPESPTVTSLRITGRKLDRLRARPGQFFIWRFLTRGHWWTAHPFSLSEAPDGESFRITAKAAGDHTSRMPRIPVGTRVVAEGPFGAFTEAARRSDKVLLVAGGIGITPVRALLERMEGDVVAIYRVLTALDIVFAGELAELEEARGVTVHYVVGDHATREGNDLLSPEHLHELVPDLAERDVYLCGPPAMTEVTAERLRHAGVHRRRLHIERFAI